LAKCPALTHLDLSVNSIKSYGAGKLAAVLAQCTALAHLDLSGNWIGDRGAGKLAGVLAQCTALAHLDLSFNRIGHEGAGKLAGVLGQCGSLAHLNLSDNQIRPAGAESLAKVLALCPALTHLDLNNNPIGDGAQRLTESWSGPEGGLMIDTAKTYYGYYEILVENWVGDSWKEPLKINDLKVPELKKMLKDRGLPTAGLKADLVERLEAAIESSGGDSSNGEESEDSIGWESEEELQ
jgi:Ran GTPase-activating protein (RanGAP) involved in mRNA processing and transport